MIFKIPKTVLVVFASLLACLSVPLEKVEPLRSGLVFTLSPFFRYLGSFQETFSSFFPAKASDRALLNEELQQLQMENQLLKAEVSRLREFYLQNHNSLWNYEDVKAVPAYVIFRSPSTWSSFLWVNVGERDNRRLGDRIIAKNSPVVLGPSVVGVIDYVGEHQSRVRLITDSQLTPAVRAARGATEKKFVANQIAILQQLLGKEQDLFATMEEQQLLLEHLQRVTKRLEDMHKMETLFLAKGELHGSNAPLWRSKQPILKGIGFNYDFADECGPARDLHSGSPIGEKGKAVPILKDNDLLVTSGLDGVFPAGLYAAEVIKVKELREGDYFYELEARPTAGNLNELCVVFVLPPIRQEE